jgi:hypothetical protein
MIGGYMGGNLNKLPMQELARHVPFSLSAKYKDDPLAREALMLGSAGFIPQASEDPFVLKLITEYDHLLRKHQTGIVNQAWKTGRVRPEQFPINRIVQWAAMVPFVEKAFDHLLDQGEFRWELIPLLPSTYWLDHINFQRATKRRSERITKKQADLIAINVHAPFLFYYGRQMGDERFVERALGLLERIRPESNSIIVSWKNHNIVPDNALDSQGLIELKRQYCDLKKCVTCNIGKSIIGKV